ncbi:MAG TPA: PGPGW domain-containing protein, partial [Propionibacteriaceae bacterium]|nr:PGPGW domain-containing protein [Propionibacteriaceae bacterium]
GTGSPSVGGRVARLVLGWTLLVTGIVALVLPGPGLLLVAAGLTVLSQQYAWAHRRVEPVRERAFRLAETSVSSRRAIVLSSLLAVWLLAAGVLWVVRPSAPGWWRWSDRWWLPGGWATGSSLILSGGLAAGLLIYSYRRFRPVPVEP